eukprot:gene10431-biopygen12361
MMGRSCRAVSCITQRYIYERLLVALQRGWICGESAVRFARRIGMDRVASGLPMSRAWAVLVATPVVGVDAPRDLRGRPRGPHSPLEQRGELGALLPLLRPRPRLAAVAGGARGVPPASEAAWVRNRGAAGVAPRVRLRPVTGGKAWETIDVRNDRAKMPTGEVLISRRRTTRRLAPGCLREPHSRPRGYCREWVPRFK